MWVEGVNYEIPWTRFKRGQSIFIPCLDPPRAKAQILDTTSRRKIKILMAIVIIDSIRGLRIWRI